MGTELLKFPVSLIICILYICRMSSLSLISAHHRKSAVELLEASKAEYVKSSRVLNNKQELKHPEKLCVQTRWVHVFLK